MEIGDTVSVQVRRIKNGYLLTGKKDLGYSSVLDEPVFVPDLDDIEGDLVNAFRLACLFNSDDVKADF